MKFTIAIFFAVLGAALAAPRPDVLLRPHIPTLSRTEIQDEAGQYAFSYQTGNGIAVAEQGALKPNKEGTDNVLVKSGSFAYITPTGEKLITTYTADERGFLAAGDHLPKDVAPVILIA